MRHFLLTAATVALLAAPASLGAQQGHPGHPKPGAVKPSQHGEVVQRIGETSLTAGTRVTVVYNRPVARGRELFGALVPYGRIWCPGADAATTIQVSTDVAVNGQLLPAGAYSVWAEPQVDEWTLIFNRVAQTFHTKYPEGQDALRIKVTPRTASHMETLAFYFSIVDGKKAELVLHWGTVAVPMEIVVP